MDDLTEAEQESAIRVGRAFVLLRKAERIRNAILRNPSSTDADRRAAHDAVHNANDHWLDMRDTV
jgi:hypothetical protein